MSDDPTPETWLPVVGYEGYYEVSDLGRVWRIEQRIEWIDRLGRANGRVFPGGYLQLKTSKQGYLEVALSRDGKARTLRVHRLILTAFRGKRPEGFHALHADDDKTNNRLSNLRWGTPMENGLDCVRNQHHHLATRERCRRGHRFAGANLVSRSEGRGRRCRACKHGDDTKHPSEAVRQQRADEFYRQLMGDEAA